MRRRSSLRPLLLAALLLFPGCEIPAGPTGTGASNSADDPDPVVRDSPDPAERPDGWAGAAGAPASPGGWGGPTTTVRTRTELVAALNAGGAAPSDQPKVIIVEGTIDLCSDASDKALTPFDFLVQAGLSQTYPTYDAWVTAYGASCALGVSSTLAATEKKLATLQKAVVVIKVGSNTTLVGKGSNAALVHGSLLVDGRTNVVIRNLALRDAADWFPVWDAGENLVNSEYDNLSISNSTRVWVDHCRLDDGENSDSSQRSITLADGVTTKKWVVHDGLIDVVRGADLVTLSWNQIRNHDKTLLFGNSDSLTTDAGKIRVTVHHNAFENAKQRLPRVRFGQVHLYNNWYSQVSGYAVGVGDKARIVSEANVFEAVNQSFAAMDDAVNQGFYVDSGSLGVTSGGKAPGTADLVGWEPSAQYPYQADPVGEVKASVQAGAGPRSNGW